MNELSWLEVNLSRLETNLNGWRAMLKGATDEQVEGCGPAICAVVKANAYGMGAVSISRRLATAGVDMLAVYTSNQAEELIHAQIVTPILVLMPTRALEQTPVIGAAAQDQRLHLAINDPMQLSMVDAFGRSLKCRLPIHLHLDTGMSRAGLNRAEFDKMLRDLPRFTSVRLAGIWSHLASAAENVDSAYDQRDRLQDALDANAMLIGPDVLVHIAASAAAARDRRFHYHMVRLGFGLYGHGMDLLSAGDGPQLTPPRPFVPVMRWVARITHLQRYPVGTTVGYGGTHRLERDSVLGVVPVGYADGYPLSLSNKAVVRLVGPTGAPRAVARVLGAVNMDQIVVDLTDCLGVCTGDLVELISSDPASPCALPKLAAAAATSPYEILCRLSPRLARTYVSVEVNATAASPRRPAEPAMACQIS